MAKETETPIVDRLAVIVAWKHENFHFWDSKTWSKVFFFLHLNLRYYRLARLKVVYEDTCPKSWNCYDENLIDSIRQHQLDFTTFQHHHWELVQLSFHFLDSHLGFNMSNNISICSWCISRHKQEGGWRELEWNHPWRSLVSSTKIELLSMIRRLHNIPFGNWFGIYSKHSLHFCLYYCARFSFSWICAQSRNRAYKTKHKESSAAHSKHSSGNTYSCFDFILDF